MKVYLVSLAVGLLVGVIYAVLEVRSPAPPAIALIGLLGMLIGEQVVPAAKRLVAGEAVTLSWLKAECVGKITGVTPAAMPSAPAAAPVAQREDGAADA